MYSDPKVVEAVEAYAKKEFPKKDPYDVEYLDPAEKVNLFTYEEEEPEKEPPVIVSDEVLENPTQYQFNTYLFHALPIPITERQNLYKEIMEEYEKKKDDPNAKRIKGKIIL